MRHRAGSVAFARPIAAPVMTQNRLPDPDRSRLEENRLRTWAMQPMAGEPPTVLVLDGEQRAALAVVRSIGRYGCQVHVGSAIPRSLAGGSRYCRSEAVLPSPLVEPDSYCHAVVALSEQCGASIVLPISEPSILALLERPAQVDKMRAQVPLPDLAHFRAASDKAEVLSLAQSIGIPVPAQWIISSRDDSVPEIPLEYYPVVVKPSRSVIEGPSARTKLSVLYANSPEHLACALSELVASAYPVLVQARVEGPGMGVFLLRWQGNTIARFAHRRIREKPPSGGVSVCSESIVAPKRLMEQSMQLMAALDWSGVAMVEFKHDTRSGTTYLMEVNPRFWGSLQLAVDAGVDFPTYLVQLAIGLPVTPIHDWTVGARLKWELGELDHLLARLLHSNRALDLPDETPSRLATTLAVMNPCVPSQRLEVLRLHDPLPAIREVHSWLRALW